MDNAIEYVYIRQFNKGDRVKLACSLKVLKYEARAKASHSPGTPPVIMRLDADEILTIDEWNGYWYKLKRDNGEVVEQVPEYYLREA